MRRLGLRFVRYFDHPNIPDGDAIRPHVLSTDLAGREPNGNGSAYPNRTPDIHKS